MQRTSRSIRIPQHEPLVDRLGRQDQPVAVEPDGFEPLLEPVDHAVEGPTDPGDLVPAGEARAEAEIAGADRIGHRGQASELAGQQMPDRPADQGDEQHAGDGDPEADAVGPVVGSLQATVRE